MTLDEIHIAEAALTKTQQLVYAEHLNNIVNTFNDDYYLYWNGFSDPIVKEMFILAHADAASREKALKKTLSK